MIAFCIHVLTLTSLYSQVHFHGLALVWNMKEENYPMCLYPRTCSENCRDLFFLKHHFSSIFYSVIYPLPHELQVRLTPYPQDLWVLTTPVTICYSSSHRDCLKINAKSKTNGNQWNLITRLWFTRSGKLGIGSGSAAA